MAPKSFSSKLFCFFLACFSSSSLNPTVPISRRHQSLPTKGRSLTENRATPPLGSRRPAVSLACGNLRNSQLCLVHSPPPSRQQPPKNCSRYRVPMKMASSPTDQKLASAAMPQVSSLERGLWHSDAIRHTRIFPTVTNELLAPSAIPVGLRSLATPRGEHGEQEIVSGSQLGGTLGANARDPPDSQQEIQVSTSQCRLHPSTE